MIDRDSLGHSYLTVRGDIIGFVNVWPRLLSAIPARLAARLPTSCGTALGSLSCAVRGGLDAAARSARSGSQAASAPLFS